MDIIRIIIGNEESFVADMKIKDVAILAIAIFLMEKFGYNNKIFLDFFSVICKYRRNVYEIMIQLYEKELTSQRVFDEFNDIYRTEVIAWQNAKAHAERILSEAFEKNSPA